MEKHFPLLVNAPGHFHAFNGDIPSTHTELFRDGTDVPLGIEVMDKRSGTENPRIVSAGCSIGGEADIGLAALNKIRPNRGASLYGFDINGKAIKAARAGRYLTVLNSDEVEAATEMLDEYGFDHKIKGFDPLYKRIAIDSAPIRKGHQVEFTRTDLSVPGLVLPKEIGLMLVNNFLAHLTPEEALAVLSNLAGSLSDSGILSIGTSNGVDLMMGDGDDQVLHSEWLDGEAAEMLEADFDLLPMDEGQSVNVRIFGR